MLETLHGVEALQYWLLEIALIGHFDYEGTVFVSAKKKTKMMTTM